MARARQLPLAATAPRSVVGTTATTDVPDPTHSRDPRPVGSQVDTDPPTGNEPLFTRDFALVMAGTASAWLAHTMALMLLTPFLVSLGFTAVLGGIGLGVIAVCALLSRIIIAPRIDRVGGRRLAISGGALLLGAGGAYVAATMVGADSAAVVLVVLGAALHGAGFGLMTTSTFTIVGEIAPLTRRGEAIGYYGASQPIIQGIAATIGFAMVATVGFGSVYFAVAVGAATTVVLFTALRHQPPRIVEQVSLPASGRVDLAIAIPVLACGVMSFVGSALVLIVPIIGLEAGIGNPGVFYLASAVSGVLGRLVTGRLSDRLGRVAVAVPGLLLLSAALVMLLLGMDAGIAVFVIAGATYGIAAAAALPALQALIIDRSPAARRGRSSAVMGMSLDVGFASGSIAFGFLVGIVGPVPGLLVAATAPFASLVLLTIDHRRQARV